MSLHKLSTGSISPHMTFSHAKRSPAEATTIHSSQKPRNRRFILCRPLPSPVPSPHQLITDFSILFPKYFFKAFISLNATVTTPSPRYHRFSAGSRDRLLPRTADGAVHVCPHSLSRLVLPVGQRPEPRRPARPWVIFLRPRRGGSSCVFLSLGPFRSRNWPLSSLQ